MNARILDRFFSSSGPPEDGPLGNAPSVAEASSMAAAAAPSSIGDAYAPDENASDKGSSEKDILIEDALDEGPLDEKAPPPWLNARYEFHRTYADLYKGKHSWKVACFAALGVAALALAGLIGRVMTSEITPYVIERDRLGQVRYAGPLPAAPETPDQALLEAELTSLIRDLRTVSTDPAIQKALIKEAFVHISGEASQYLDDFFSQKGENPRALGQKLRRSVQIHSVIRVPGTQTYKIEWTETIRSTAGSGADPKRQAWEAYVSVEQHDPSTLEAARKNPLGVYVTAIEWTSVSETDASEGDPSSEEDP